MHTLIKSRVISEIKACLTLAIPLAGAQLAQSATAFVDTVMMGLLGSQTIAAGGLGAMIFNALLITTASVVSSVSPLAAEAYGSGKVEQIGRIIRQGLWLSLILAIPVMLLIWHLSFFLRLMGQEESTVVLTETFLRAIAWGFFPAVGFAALRHFVSALSRTRPIIVVMLCGTLFNIVANYVLSFGKLGLPALGLAGIGWASTLSLWGMFIALTTYVVCQPQFQIYGVFRNLHQLDWQVSRELLKIGLPIGILAAVETGLFTMTALLMGQLGAVALAAHQIALQTAAQTFMIPLGVSLATTVRVGQLIGQDNFRAAQLAGFIGISIGAVFMGAMAILFWLIPEQITSLYLDIHNPANAEVVKLAETLLRVAALFQIMDGIQVTAAGALRGLKDTYIPMIIGIFAYWGIGLPSGYILGLRLGFGGPGLWCGLAIGLAIAAVILTWRFSAARSH